MAKYINVLLVTCLMAGGLQVCLSNAQHSASIREYGNLKLMDSLDHGKLWPKQKAQLRHAYLNRMKQRFHALPSAQQKQKALNSLKKRIEAIEQRMERSNI